MEVGGFFGGGEARGGFWLGGCGGGGGGGEGGEGGGGQRGGLHPCELDKAAHQFRLRRAAGTEREATDSRIITPQRRTLAKQRTPIRVAHCTHKQ